MFIFKLINVNNLFFFNPTYPVLQNLLFFVFVLPFVNFSYSINVNPILHNTNIQYTPSLDVPVVTIEAENVDVTPETVAVAPEDVAVAPENVAVTTGKVDVAHRAMTEDSDDDCCLIVGELIVSTKPSNLRRPNPCSNIIDLVDIDNDSDNVKEQHIVDTSSSKILNNVVDLCDNDNVDTPNVCDNAGVVTATVCDNDNDTTIITAFLDDLLTQIDDDEENELIIPNFKHGDTIVHPFEGDVSSMDDDIEILEPQITGRPSANTTSANWSESFSDMELGFLLDVIEQASSTTETSNQRQKGR